MRILKLSLAMLALVPAAAQSKPRITLDEFFSSVSFSGLEMAPDGTALVIATERADWDQQIFRKDLWLYRFEAKGGSLVRLTESGHDTTPRWSPDGNWIAFLSDRKVEGE
ncbi:MAG: PD40 domain-containing protein, partial [Acidobacteria bacterium]|nr:PD40 domain-containing protein [Acidobacteriota bacterium]